MVDFVKATWRPSPNYWPGRSGYEIQYIVLHGTDGQMPGCLDWLCSPQSGASVHYLVACTGDVYQLVNEHDTAWGNGIVEPPSPFLGRDNPNFYTCSVEHERWDANTSPMTPAQIASSLALIADIRARHGAIPCIPHSDIAPQSRMHCPGPAFPFSTLDGSVPNSAGLARTWVRFDATPQKIPLVFYADASFAKPLYVSAATAKTVVHFDGWAYGASVLDPSAKAQDRRWYHRNNPGGQAGWTPSAWVLGNAPGSRP